MVRNPPPPYALIMDNLKILLAATVDKARGNASGSIMERFTKSRASTMFGHPAYFLDGTGPSISVSGPHEDFFNSDTGVWICGKNVLVGCCRTVSMHKLWKALGLRHIGV